jgi:hypothetical protein
MGPVWKRAIKCPLSQRLQAVLGIPGNGPIVPIAISVSSAATSDEAFQGLMVNEFLPAILSCENQTPSPFAKWRSRGLFPQRLCYATSLDRRLLLPALDQDFAALT